MPELTAQQAMPIAARHYQAGRLAEAESICRQILAVHPDHFEAMHLLGLTVARAGRDAEAVELLRKSVSLSPANAQYQRNLGIQLRISGDLDSAIASFRQSIAIKPDYADAHYALGVALMDKGQPEQAIAHYREAIRLRPKFPEAYYSLGAALEMTDQLDRAIAQYEQAVEIKPDFAEAWNNLGNARAHNGQVEQAIQCYQRALRHKPNFAQAHNNLGAALRRAGQLDLPVECFERALKLRPNYLDALLNLCDARMHMGQVDAAIACCQRAQELYPDLPPVESNLIYLKHFDPRFDADAIHAGLRDFNQRWRRPAATHHNDRSPERRLRIGYVSPNFREHVVGWNLLPLLEQHNHQDFEIVCYSDVSAEDVLTRQLAACADAWHKTFGLTDAQIASRIRQDQIDILVDLTLHSTGNRMPLFALKPAPIQFTYLGYCGSTGLEAVDYRFSDAYLDPPAALDPSTEKTIRLPCYWCYRPGGVAPDVSPLPEKIVFTCLNNFAKVSSAAIDLWKQILDAVPQSRLLIQSDPGSHRDGLRTRLGDRVDFAPRRPWNEYIARYLSASISLDPFPYAGGITSCDSMWMGVPVVTLAGNMPVRRGGVTILSQIGLTELIAQSPQQYARIAIDLAGDPSRLSELRRTLRDRMKSSPLMDAAALARHVEDAYRSAWQTWCASEAKL